MIVKPSEIEDAILRLEEALEYFRKLVDDEKLAFAEFDNEN
jgi:hypothetical protein